MDKDESTGISYSTISNGHRIIVKADKEASGSLDNTFYYPKWDFTSAEGILLSTVSPNKHSTNRSFRYGLIRQGYICDGCEVILRSDFCQSAQRPALSQ